MAAIGSSTSVTSSSSYDFRFGLGTGIYSLPTEMIKLVGKVFVDAVSAVTLALTCREIKQLIPPTLPKSKFCKEAAKLGYLEPIQWGVDQNCRWTPGASAAAAKTGHMQVLRWAWNKGWLGFEKTANNAAKGNHVDVLDWLFEKGAELVDSIADAAASKGHIELFQDLKVKLMERTEDEHDGIRVNPEVILKLIEAENLTALRALLTGTHAEDLEDPDGYIDNAAGVGNLDVFKFFIELGLEVNNFTVRSAALWGNINILEYILVDLQERDLFNEEIVEVAAHEENWDTVRWLISRNIKGSSLVAIMAIEQNRMDELELIEKAGWPITKEASRKAAEMGRWDVVQKLMDKGIFCESFCYYFYAAKQNRIDLLEILKEKNAPRSIENSAESKHLLSWASGDADLLSRYGIAMAAASGGTVETMRWVKHNGFEWQHERVTFAAACGGNLATLEWLLQRDCPYVSEQLYQAAASSKTVHIIEWLSGFPFETRHDIVGVIVANAGKGDVLKRLVGKGCPVNAYTIAAAASSGHWDIVHWLMAIGCDWNQRVIEAAAEQGKDEFLHTHIFEEIKRSPPVSFLQADRSEYMDFMDKLRPLAEHGHWELFKTVVTDYVYEGNQLVLEWVKGQGYGFDVEAVTAAAQSLRVCGNYHALGWLRANHYLKAEE
jgi:hypothetical protein